MGCLEKLMTEFGMNFDRWRQAARKTGRWFRRVEEGAEAFMQKQRDAENGREAEHHAAIALPTAATKSCARRGGGAYPFHAQS